MRERQFELTRRLEEDYAQRIEALLTPFVGPGRVRAQVVAQVDTSVTEEAREQYRPDSQIVRSEQTAESASRDGAGPQGVPGALSNQPPTPGQALPPNATPPANATPAAPGAAAAKAQGAAAANTQTTAPPDNTSRSSTRNYEIDRTMAYTKTPSGRLQRLTVAVLVDNLRTTGPDGKTKSTALTQDQLDHITKLVKDAVGFNEQRGDSVNVVNSAFREEAAQPPGELETTPIWEQPFVRDMAKIVAGLIVLLVLVLTVLRPLTRGLLANHRTSAPQVLFAAEDGGPSPAAQARAVNNGGNASGVPPLAYEQQLAQARTLVGQDPKRVAQVVRTWVGQDE
jgi:flagellar M-ring protein FliF